MSVGGISAAILQYLTSREEGQSERTEKMRLLRQDLVRTIYETEDDNDELDPPCIELPATDRERAQSQFLASLEYDGMIDRESRIATAHESTFRWVFRDTRSLEPSSRVMRWSNMQEWFESEDQLYWITGKAGSGKSTLMKYLSTPTSETSEEHRTLRCHPYLKKWAGSLKLVVATFYFWNSGLELQMTQAGLLRTLLYQIVAQRPHIIPMIAPKHWEALCLFDQQVEHSSVQDLRTMLFRAVKILRKDSKVCLFVDGLDEFAHSHEDLIALIKTLIGDNGHVKVCVSSRPWNIFQAALEHEASLRLEDLTFEDIKGFVQSKFSRNSEFENLRRRYPSFADELMENIVVKASGVFLWVDLVVSSLLAGMRQRDKIEDFQRRLNDLPQDLEELYEKILFSLDPFYLEQAAQYFTLVESADAPLTIMQFSFADEESPKSAIKMGLVPLTADDVSVRIEAMSRRLNSRCKGFLETERGLQGHQTNTIRRSSLLTVQYLHRTVRDFLKTPRAQSFLQSSTKCHFDPAMQLCVAYLMDVKAWYSRNPKRSLLDHDGKRLSDLDRDHEDPAPYSNIIRCFRRAASVARVNEGAVLALLEELKTVLHRHEDNFVFARKTINGQETRNPFTRLMSSMPTVKAKDRFDFKAIPRATIDQSLLAIAIKYNVIPYVRARTEWGGSGQPLKPHQSEERVAMLLFALGNAPEEIPEPRIVECLLDGGVDPNFKISGLTTQTPWLYALSRAAVFNTTILDLGSPAELLHAENQWKQTLKVMYSRGAVCTRLQFATLTSTAKRLVQTLKDENASEGKGQDLLGLTKWLAGWKLG